jgi:predicted nucleic acid-binding protein
MKLVLDASVGLKAVLEEEHSDLARRLMEEFRKGVHELIAPDVYPIECGHALTRAERKKLIGVGDSSTLFEELMASCPELKPSLPLLERAVELSSTTRAGVYDCLYALLAEDEDCRVITADSGIPSSRILRLSDF